MKIWRSLICLIMVLVLVTGLAACGNKEGAGGSGNVSADRQSPAGGAADGEKSAGGDASGAGDHRGGRCGKR